MAIRSSVGRGGINRRGDVELVQALLNEGIGRLTPLRPLRVDGLAGPLTIGAIEEYQSRVVGMQRPDGRVDPGRRTILSLLAAPQACRLPPALQAAGQPRWIRIARGEIGVKERRGPDQNHPDILKYLRTVPALANIRHRTGSASGHIMSEVDETPWCGCFVNWCLIQAGKRPNRGIDAARARKWLDYGTKLQTPRVGAIAVIYKQPSGATAQTTVSGFHVGFYVGQRGGAPVLLGGNQSNAVNEKAFAGWQARGYRWPA